MRNDQRLIPFLGGLAIGGIGGSIIDNNKINYAPYPYYVYPYPQYNYYPTMYNYQYPPLVNSPYYASKTMGDVPSIVTNYKYNQRNLDADLSYVPIYRIY